MSNWKTSSHSVMNDMCVEADGPWRISSYCAVEVNCVEVSKRATVRVRDTKDRARGRVTAGAQAWGVFLAMVKGK